MKHPVDEVKYDDKGLVPVIVQDYLNNEVLMVAYMNRESLRTTLETGITHFWSRSRQKFWKKGETSGHIQQVKEVLIDCDHDALVMKVDQNVAACHTGHRSCFYRRLRNGEFEVFQEKVFDEEKVY
ncbi:MAG TPA: phosphoribosyl-AMP cyclohydrolase [Thermodesulfobacteriota bacterium]|nr:phosphoribosyl-AMP cyclohydrolase [Deltaproteobacteria bacterium]HNU71811.1 phosphoribosyl-AMP cyclohydrolase [Thermodesulfobacteriota bacterium]